MAKDINIHVKTTGAGETQKQLEGVGHSAQRAGGDVKGGSDKGKAGLETLSGEARKSKEDFGGMADSVAGWAVSLASVTAVIAAITKAIRLQSEAMREHAQITQEQQKKLVALQHLGDMFERRPELRKEVAAYAEFGRRPFEQVAEAWYTLESQGAGLSDQQKQGIMKEALELGRQEPEADLSSIVGMFSLYVKETKQADINQVQNILRQTITSAGSEMGQVGELLPRFLSIGMAGGLSAAEAAGLWAYATTKTGQAEMATMGLKNIFLSLEGKGTPESQEFMTAAGIQAGMNFFDKIERLDAERQAGRLGLPQAVMLAGGKENAALLLSMMSDPKAMMQTVSEVRAAARPDVDLVREQLQAVLGTDEIAKLEDDIRQMDVAIRNVKAGDVNALKWEKLLKEYELGERQAGTSEYNIALHQWIHRKLMALGVSAEAAETLGLIAHTPEKRKELKRQGTLVHYEMPGEQAEAQPQAEGPPALEPPQPEQPGFELYQPPAPAPAGEQPAGPQASAGVTIHNHYDSRQFFTPVVGTDPADLGIGGLPRGVA